MASRARWLEAWPHVASSESSLSVSPILLSIHPRFEGSNMRFVWVAAAVLLSTFAVPLATPFVPYMLFHMYARETAAQIPKDHANASSRSILAAAQSVLCMVSYLSVVPLLCGGPPDIQADKTEVDFSEFSTAVRVFLEQLVLQAPRSEAFARIVSLERAADAALDVDASLMLAQEGSRYITGIGDVLALSQIRRISRELSASLPRIIAHLELTVARTLFMQGTAVAGLSLLNDIDLFRTYVSGANPPRFHHIVIHMTGALQNSTRFTAEAVQDSLVLSTALSAALAQFRAHRNNIHDCRVGSSALCESLTPLLRGDAILSSVVGDLETLAQVLDEGFVLPLPHANSHPAQVVQFVVEAHQHVLRKQLLLMWWIRQAMENERVQG
ncbi:hypothetical protein TRAPUB_1065 [Trametes pubescens]|uniref:Uncharacterized protein n=1 Tax=Trametes pubescens TaxID=154538 RepID=A0A1M2VKA8_TRAPU|nr:hypothetical protein TRAPUB_1065 [Trametes pubescens]